MAEKQESQTVETPNELIGDIATSLGSPPCENLSCVNGEDHNDVSDPVANVLQNESEQGASPNDAATPTTQEPDSGNCITSPAATDMSSSDVGLEASASMADNPNSEDLGSGVNNPTTDEPSPGVEGQQVLIVNKMIKTVGRLRTENAILSLKISDSDTQNKLLQLQIDIMMKKMEILEGFMAQVNEMDSDAVERENNGLCRRCKQQIESSMPEKSADSDEDSDYEDLSSWRYGSARDYGDGYQNPLLIDIVIANIMSFLPASSLLNCRLVNRVWNTEATYILRQRQTFTINHDNIDKLPVLLKLTNNSFSGNFLFRKVRFDIGFLVKTYRDMIEEFFSKYGSEIHHFSIHCEQENSSILYTEEVRNVLLPFLTNVQVLEISLPTKITERQTIYDDIRPKKFNFSQLTTLKLRHMEGTLDIGGYSVAVVKELLKVGPNLRCLGIETHTKEVLTRILTALNDKECQKITNQLQELYLDAFITEEHLRLLLPLEFKLKKLQLSYFSVDVTSAMLEALLAKQRTTLETLVVGDYQKRTTINSLPLIIKLPVLRELKHLKFVDPLFPDSRQIIFSPLSYADQLPALKELSFDHEMGKPAGPHYFHDVFVCSPSTCSTLTVLKISHGLGDTQLVTSAAKMFPNLKRLEIANVPDPVLQFVWKEFTGIQTLYLVLNPTNLNIDALMTGIPDQVCRRIQEKNLFSQVDLMNALDIIRTEPAICHLTELETLRIDGITSSLITACTGYLALCHMKHLSNISIKSDIITLSRECRRILGEKLHLNLFEFF
ncbi:hypothetical protein Ocin01_18341 [Orchesella cincta]|uniref:Uncharacterized protein n=1 Tax=Orchesella cincta TaxID=48709 RepID=A0A1D2M5Z6_ORCCI|nr:hypothetical protein Ocin01_18341 [Orchesella cincta]